MSIHERILADGTKRYDVIVYTGFTFDGVRDRKKVTCRTKRAAEIEEARLKSMTDAMRGRSGKMALSDFIDRVYWPVASKRLAATSLDTYDREVRLRIEPCLGNVDIRDINRQRVQRMVDNCSTSDVAKKAVGVLKTIMNDAKGHGLVISNPCEATFAMPQKGRKRDNGFVLTTFEQIGVLLAIVRQNGSQSVQRIAYTGLLQGMRPEERYALDWEDLDIQTMSITIDSAYVAASKKHGGVQKKPTKTERSHRVIPMHPDFAEWLEGVPSGGGPFILGADGKRISPSTAQKRWRRFLDDNAGKLEKERVAPVTIENMRHSFATSYLHAGGNVADLSLILGHADINTTLRRYVRPNVDDLRRGLMAASCRI